MTYDGNFSIYIDGKLDKTSKADFIYNFNPGAKMSLGGKKYFGKMRYIGLENRSLSAEEIRELYLKTK